MDTEDLRPDSGRMEVEGLRSESGRMEACARQLETEDMLSESPASVIDFSFTAHVPDMDCPICTEVMCDPLRLDCDHCFCRVCLIQSTYLAPDGRSCPLCRQRITMKNPHTHPVDERLCKAIEKAVGIEVIEARREDDARTLEALIAESKSKLPIFAMYPGCRVGEPVFLHFFEPRYKILIRRAWEGNKLFVFCGERPRAGARGIVVKVLDAVFLPDGRSNIRGVGKHEVVLGETWVEEGTQGLAMTRVDVLNSALNRIVPTAESVEPAVRCQCSVM